MVYILKTFVNKKSNTAAWAAPYVKKRDGLLYSS